METTVRSLSSELPTILGRRPVALFNSKALDLASKVKDAPAWILTQGYVDLFIVERHLDGHTGARYPIGRVETDQALLPWADSVPVGWFVLPLASSDACGFQVAVDELFELALDQSSGNMADQVGASLVQGISLLCAALPGVSNQPRTPVLLSPGENRAASRDAVAMAPHVSEDAELLWFSVDDAPALLVGRSDLLVPANILLPLAPPAWIETACAVKTMSTADAIRLGLAHTALAAFYPLLLNGVVHKIREGIDRERDRLADKQRGDSNRVNASMRLLSGTLQRRQAPDFSAHAALGDNLMTAFDAIGAVQGIEFKPPPELLRGETLRDPVASIARISGVRSRRVVLSTEGWNQSESPFLAFRELDRAPLACLPKSGKRYVVFDPATFTVQPLTEEFLRTLEPFVFLFYRPFPNRVIKAKDLVSFGLKGSWKDVALVVMVGLAGSGLSLATPIVTGTIFDSIIPGAQRSRLVMTAFILAAASLSSVLFNLSRSFAILRLEGKMDSRVQAAVWDRLLGLPARFFSNYSAGDLASRGLAIASMRQILTGSALSSLMSGIFSVTSFCLLFHYSSHLAFLATGLTAIALLMTTLCSYLQIRRQREMLELHGRLTGILLQFLMGIAKLRVSGTENRAFVAWATSFAKQKSISVRSRRTSNVLAVFNAIFPVASTMAIFYLTIHEMAKPGSKPLSTGNFLAFNSAYAQFSGAILSLTSVFLSLLSIVPLYERAKPILETLPEVDATKPHAGDLSGHIELNHINFRYREDGPLILKDVSLNIRPGEFVAFVGPSGAGKSTLFRLFLGFDVPESGAIYFDGQDLQKIDIQSVRQQMGVVMQNASLFAGDIFSNITCSAPYSLEEAWDAAKLAGFEKDLREMPMGLHTVLGDGGAGLSGGQRQRLMISRAIVGRPRILLFDEATSALDNQTQALVSASLENLNSTRVVIAHRLSTIVHADRIYVVEAGAIVQVGTYEELMQQSGLFRELAKRQVA